MNEGRSYEAANHALHLHVLEPDEPTVTRASLPLEETPAGLVWQTQQPLILSNLAEDQR